MPYPYKTLRLNRAMLVALMNATIGRVHYKLGAKADLDEDPKNIHEIDCSGYARWLLHGCTKPQVVLPDGSANQNTWCRNQNFKPVDYAKVAGLKDNRLRIAFIRPEKGSDLRHVWLVINGQTIESCGGHGPHRRPWDTPILKDNVDNCYVLTGVLK